MGIVSGNVRVEHDILVRGKRIVHGIRNRIYSEVDGCGLCSAVNICDGIGKAIGTIKIGVGRVAKGPIIIGLLPFRWWHRYSVTYVAVAGMSIV